MSVESREDIPLEHSSLLHHYSQKRSSNHAETLPDLHGLRPSAIHTEMGTNDAQSIKQVVATASSKPALRTVSMRGHPLESIDAILSEDEYQMAGGFYPSPRSRIPDEFRTGWTSFSDAQNPGGSLPIPSTYKRKDWLDEMLPDFTYGEWYHNAAALVTTAVIAFCLGKVNASLGTIILFCLAMGTYYQTSMRRFRQNARDDIQRELSKITLEDEEEPVEWMNAFLQKFWLIFEPVLSALVVEHLDTYITAYLPSYIDSIRLSTFTLGTKPFRIETVKTFESPDADTVCMDWRVSFTPNDLTDMSPEQLDDKVNPRVTLLTRFGRRSIGAAFPVLLEDMTFQGYMRIKIKFTSRFPYAKIIEASFLEKPTFDYVLKPLGRDSFGFDVNLIPGLQSFITYQVHEILGPLMYAPNAFTFDVEKFMAGDFDISQANGVLAVTIYKCDFPEKPDEIIQDTLLHDDCKLYVRFFIDHGQELGRTTLCSQAFDARWNETQFLLLNNLNAQLSLELRANIPHSKDRRLATANFDLRRLDDENCQTLERTDLLMLRDGKRMCDVQTEVHYLPVSKPFKRADGTIEPAQDSNSGVLRLTVHECYLEKRGNSRCRVLVNGIEKFVTTTVKRNANPTFEEADEIVILDKSSVSVRVEVRGNHEKFTEESLLGSWSSSLTDLMNQQEVKDAWWNLSSGSKADAGRLRLSAQWKPVNMSTLAESLGIHGFETPAIGVVRFEFQQARDLLNVELSGKSDPYVRVLSGNQTRAQTDVIDNNLEPEWGEVHYVPVHANEGKLQLEVMDWNARTKDRSLGVVDVKLAELHRQCVGEQAVDPDIWYASTGKKIDEWALLRSTNRNFAKGSLRYTASFIPTLALPASMPSSVKDLHETFIKYTPDGLVDLMSYNSGVIKIRIHSVELLNHAHAYCAVKVDSVAPQFQTGSLRGSTLDFDETADMFVKDLSLSTVTIEVRPFSTEKHERILDKWTGSVIDIVRLIQRQRRGLSASSESNESEDSSDDKRNSENSSECFFLRGRSGSIRLGFDYIPLADFTLPPDESPDNQGLLTVQLVKASNLKGVDRSGTSDPYVMFWFNGVNVFKSERIRKQLSPVWKNTKFKLSVPSRAVSSFRIEVFDWNKVQLHEILGSGAISLNELQFDKDEVLVDIPLNGVEKVSGSVQLKLSWEPKPLSRKAPLTTSSWATERLSTDLDIVPIKSRSTSSVVSDGATSNGSGVRYSIDSVSLAPTLESVLQVTSETTGKDGHITLVVLKARGLYAADKSGTSDPYVEVKMDKNKLGKTAYIKKTLEPEWNESFTTSVTSKSTTLALKVKDKNKFHNDVMLGRHIRNIWDLVLPGQQDIYEGWLDLRDENDPSKGGQILVRLEYSA